VVEHHLWVLFKLVLQTKRGVHVVVTLIGQQVVDKQE
jgi:hypothetical protein